MKLHRMFSAQYRSLRLVASLALGVAIMPCALFAQSYAIANYTDPLAPGYVYRASSMLSTGNPLGAIDQTSASLADFESLSLSQKADWLAYEGSALFERGDAACVEVLTRLANDFPTNPKATQALLTLGDWYWYNKDWHEAIAQYAKVDIQSLNSGQRPLYSYRKALAYLRCGLPESAAPLIASIASAPGYERAAKFYTAYIHYLDKDYDSAYQMMEEVASGEVVPVSAKEENPQVRIQGSAGRVRRGRTGGGAGPNLVPAQRQYVSDGIEPLYYMAQIEYLRGQYDDVIEHAATIMAKNPVDDLLPELHRIAGLSYFKKGEYDAARPHLELFVESVEYPNDDALYALGAIQYADGDMMDAEKNLRQLTDRNNDLAQGSYLYLGQIAEQRGDMNAAAMAFEKAANMAYDRNVAETALYNHIVALTKGGNAPFASNIRMLEDFIGRYPDSRYASEVQESLAAAYFYEHDYAAALASINKVRNPSEATLATKQKILYKLGVSEITSGALHQAVDHLGEAANMKSADPALADESRLWLAEGLYALDDFKAAAAAYSAALRGSLTGDNKLTARYGLAYSQFKMKEWSDARKNFAEVAENRDAPASMKGDALIRAADCLLYLGDYQKAADLFLRASREGAGDADYAAFRYAVVVGITEGTDSKMRKLNAFLKDKPSSKWTPEVLLEAGNTMAALDQPDKAAPYFERLRQEFPKDNKSRRGALSLALAYVKQDETEKAKEAYMEIIRVWPTSEEASIANDDMRRITAADGSLKEYARFLERINGAPRIDPDEMDAITFEAAETAYAANQSNTQLLEQYVSDFPDGRYLANALMDLAEAADNEGDAAKALIYLDKLLSARADSPQVPAALFLRADLLENAGDKKKALASYLDLELRGGVEFAPEAIAGVMRTTSDAPQRTEYARRLLSMGGVTAEDAEEARFYEASGLLHSSQSNAGEAALKRLAASPNSISGAKAAVELGDWYLEKGDTKNALSILESFTDTGSVHAYWLARGFISLADAYHADGNDYLAVEYLKSLRDNYPGEETDISEAIEARIKEYSNE
ncbi:MAG: tetratricopeptide repeat protein [Muribaculaceae bacterium]|nr:tetratricopeptide repeat protein [Muribaculaceae bacterium]